MFMLALPFLIWALLGAVVAWSSPNFAGIPWIIRIINLTILVYVFLLAGAGIRLATDLRTIKRILIAFAIGAALEGIIILHDSMGMLGLGSVWFLDRAMYRLRGTFRASGQLGQYGMAALFLCYAFAAWPGIKRGRRVAVYAVAAVGGLGTYYAARRSAAFCILVWVALLAVRSLTTKAGRRSIISIVVVVLVGVVVIWMSLGRAEFASWSVGQHEAITPSGLRTMYQEGGWFREQVRDGFRILSDHPVLGCGIGHAFLLTSTGAELHNGFLALLVETGPIGAILVAIPLVVVLKSVWRVYRMSNGTPWRDFAERLALPFVAWIPFSIHNRFWRDRAFWIAVVVVWAMEAFLTQYHQRQQAMQYLEVDGQSDRAT